MQLLLISNHRNEEMIIFTKNKFIFIFANQILNWLLQCELVPIFLYLFIFLFIMMIFTTIFTAVVTIIIVIIISFVITNLFIRIFSCNKKNFHSEITIKSLYGGQTVFIFLICFPYLRYNVFFRSNPVHTVFKSNMEHMQEQHFRTHFFFYFNEFTLYKFTLYKLQIKITCLRLKIYGINPVSNWI